MQLITFPFRLHGSIYGIRNYMKVLQLTYKLVCCLLQGFSGLLRLSAWLLKRAASHKYGTRQTQVLAQREAQQRMEEFLSIAGHELKTPLTSIKGNIQLVQRRIKSSTN